GLLEVILEGLADRLVGAGVAELLDPQLGVGLRRRGGRGKRRIDAIGCRVGVAGDLEVDQRRAAVLRYLTVSGVGTGDVANVLRRLQPSDGVVDTGAERRV